MGANAKAIRHNTEDDGETPRYKLSEAAYIDDVLYEVGATISYAGVPGYHMEPVNDAAVVMKEKHPSKYIDPILAMTDLKVVDTSASQMGEVIAASLVKALLAARETA